MTPWAGGGAQATPLHVQPIHYPPPARIVAGPIMCGAARHYPLHATSSFANPNLPRLGGRVAHHAQIPWQRGFFHSYRVRDSYDRGTQRSHGSAQPPALRSVQRAHLRHKMQGKAFSPLGVMVATCLASGRGQSRSKSAFVLVLEALLLATNAFDWGAGIVAYRKLPTLREYALIGPGCRSLNLFRCESNRNRWVRRPINAGVSLTPYSAKLRFISYQMTPFSASFDYSNAIAFNNHLWR